jgi:hypothetical protein
MIKMIVGKTTPIVMRNSFGDFPFLSFKIVQDWV